MHVTVYMFTKDDFIVNNRAIQIEIYRTEKWNWKWKGQKTNEKKQQQEEGWKTKFIVEDGQNNKPNTSNIKYLIE